MTWSWSSRTGSRRKEKMHKVDTRFIPDIAGVFTRYLCAGSRKVFTPGTSSDLRKQLVKAVKNAHEALVAPPGRLKPEQLARWKPRIRTDIDWASLQSEPGSVQSKNNDQSLGSVGKAEAKKARKSKRQEALADRAVKQTALEVDASDAEQEVSREIEGSDREEMRDDIQPPFLSIGLIGQPK